MNKKQQIKHIIETEADIDIITNKICKLYDKTIETKTEIKPDYEILNFKQNSGITDLWTYFENQGWARNNKGKIQTKPYKSLNDILNNHLNGGIEYNINSVRRISDNTVFTIGDNVQIGWSKSKHIIRSITVDNRFPINNEHSLSFCINTTVGYKLNELKKIKQPLFTTEDGVDIYEGDKIYSIESSLNEINEKIAGIYKHSTHNHPVEHWYNDDKYFSTKDAAKQYILMNKPCLSIKEIAPIIGKVNDSKFIDLDKLTDKLQKLVKTKL